ncbi:hypothetical protein VB779_08685 [Haloarculaceae archaeon H-GB11]|nr:hypothetical protein [Haloarculaceae archaeon H-GB11]
MTGAGSGELLLAHEDSFKGTVTDSDSSGTPETYEFGRDPTITELDLQRTLARMRQQGNVEAVESVATQVEGAVAVEAAVSDDVHSEIETLVFNDGGTSFKAGRPNSGRIYTSVDYLDGTESRELIGVIPLEYSVSYGGDGMLRYSLVLGYATEDRDVSIPTGDVTRVSTGTSVPFHGFTLTLDSAAVTKLQTAQLTISNIARFQRGGDPSPVDAVIAAPETELTMEAIIDTSRFSEVVYGTSGATSVQDTVDSFSGSATLDANGTTVSTYNLPKIKPANRATNNLVDADNDTTEQLSFNVDGGVTVS